MKTIELWHGSAHHIGKPSFGLGKTYKDFGLGFYCTENLELAKEWACTEQDSGYANHYSLTLDDLIILNLSDDKYTILNWLALLVAIVSSKSPLPWLVKVSNTLRYIFLSIFQAMMPSSDIGQMIPTFPSHVPLSIMPFQSTSYPGQ